MNAKKVALVTGGSCGIGLGVAKYLAEYLAGSGFDVAVHGRRPEAEVRPALAGLEA